MTLHYHFCPNCYDREACQYDCEIEPDLGLTWDGHPKSSPVRCSRCGPEPDEQAPADFFPDKVAELRALATGWDNEAARLRQGYVPADIDSRLRLTDPIGLSRELSRRARDLSEKASAIFAIVGGE